MRDTAFALFAAVPLILGCNQITGLNELNLSLDTGSETSSVVDNSTDTASTSTQSSDDTDNDTVSDTATDTSTTTDTDASSDSSKDIIDDTVSDSASDTQTDTATYTGSDTGDDTSSDSAMDTQSDTGQDTFSVSSEDIPPDAGDDTSSDSTLDTQSDTDTNANPDTGTEEIPAVCGDGIKHPTEEVCDMGESNGEFDQCDVSCLFICNRNCPLRVDLVNGDDGNDGKSWGAAKLTIQAAIDAQSSASGGDVWVTTGESSGSIAMAPGVPLYGGFAGTERVVSERDADSRTTLRGVGDLPVVAGARNSEINGFHIVDGSATYYTSTNPKINGGGLAAVNISSLTVANCIFENNTAIQFGGAMTIENSTVDIIDSSFLSNYASSGGAISITDSSTVTISGARFDTNYLVDSGPFAIVGGGALYVTDSTLTVTDCDFVANAPYDITETTEIAFGYGTAIKSVNGTVIVRDSEFYGNLLMIPERSVVTHNNTATQYINCTFAGHGGPTDNAVVQFEGSAESAVVGCTFSLNDMIQVNASTATNASITNTLFYMTLMLGEDAYISGTPTEQNNCSNYVSGRLSTSLVLEASPSDGDGDGVPEYFLRQNDDNPCFIMGGDDSAADAAGIDWENMTTAQSGCTDVSPVDVGRHYSVAAGSHECL